MVPMGPGVEGRAIPQGRESEGQTGLVGVLLRKETSSLSSPLVPSCPSDHGRNGTGSIKCSAVVGLRFPRAIDFPLYPPNSSLFSIVVPLASLSTWSTSRTHWSLLG